MSNTTTLLVRCLAAGGVQLGEQVAAESAQLPALPAPQACTLLVPSERVLSERWSLPKLRRRDALRAIPFMLEERLIEDLSELQLSCLSVARGSYHVWAIARHWLEQQMKALAAQGYHVTRVLPDYWRVPFQPAAWSIWVEEQQAWIRTDAWYGLAVPLAQLPSVLVLLRQTLASSQAIQINSYGLDAAQRQAIVSELGEGWEWQVNAVDLPKSLQLYEPPNIAGNLLSPTAAVPRVGNFSRERGWHWASVAACLAGGLALAVTGSQWWRQAADLRSIQQQIALPGIHTPAQAWQLVRQQVPTAKVTTIPWLQTLQAIAPSVLSASGLQLIALQSQATQWRITVVGYSVTALSEFKQRLQQQGLHVLAAVIHTEQRAMRAEFTVEELAHE